MPIPLDECIYRSPKAQVSTYTNGAKILRALIAGEKRCS